MAPDRISGPQDVHQADSPEGAAISGERAPPQRTHGLATCDGPPVQSAEQHFSRPERFSPNVRGRHAFPTRHRTAAQSHTFLIGIVEVSYVPQSMVDHTGARQTTQEHGARQNRRTAEHPGARQNTPRTHADMRATTYLRGRPIQSLLHMLGELDRRALAADILRKSGGARQTKK